MSRYAALTGKQVLLALQRLGFESVRVRSRHHVLRPAMAEKQWFLSIQVNP